MRNRWLVAVVLWAAGAASVAAANFWETKSYTDWSQKEVDAMLTDSPWARKISVVVPVPPRGGGDDAGGRGGGGDDGGGRGGRVGGAFPVAAPQLKLVITWRSALPMRQALLRSESGANSTTPGQQPLVDRNEPFYVVTLAGVPARYARAAAATAGAASFLRRGNNKMPIALAEGGVSQDGATLTIIFEFPRTDPITLEDKEVEFVTKLGEVEIKKKFNLKELVFHGQLDL
jgi:hypothetical protein